MLDNFCSWCSRRVQCNTGVFLRSSSNVIELLDESRWSNDTRFKKISVSWNCFFLVKDVVFGEFDIVNRAVFNIRRPNSIYLH